MFKPYVKGQVGSFSTLNVAYILLLVRIGHNDLHFSVWQSQDYLRVARGMCVYCVSSQPGVLNHLTPSISPSSDYLLGTH